MAKDNALSGLAAWIYMNTLEQAKKDAEDYWIYCEAEKFIPPSLKAFVIAAFVGGFMSGQRNALEGPGRNPLEVKGEN
jgi:hypothetical protein